MYKLFPTPFNDVFLSRPCNFNHLIEKGIEYFNSIISHQTIKSIMDIRIEPWLLELWWRIFTFLNKMKAIYTEKGFIFFQSTQTLLHTFSAHPMFLAYEDLTQFYFADILPMENTPAVPCTELFLGFPVLCHHFVFSIFLLPCEILWCSLKKGQENNFMWHV